MWALLVLALSYVHRRIAGTHQILDLVNVHAGDGRRHRWGGVDLPRIFSGVCYRIRARSVRQLHGGLFWRIDGLLGALALGMVLDSPCVLLVQDAVHSGPMPMCSSLALTVPTVVEHIKGKPVRPWRWPWLVSSQPWLALDPGAVGPMDAVELVMESFTSYFWPYRRKAHLSAYFDDMVLGASMFIFGLDDASIRRGLSGSCGCQGSRGSFLGATKLFRV